MQSIPISKEENVVQVVVQIGATLIIEVKDSMIDACHKLKKISDGGISRDYC